MFKLKLYLVLFTLAAISSKTTAIVGGHRVTTNDMTEKAREYSSSVGRVYFKGGQKSTTPAAIISEKRALVFTDQPQDIEYIELEKDGNDVTKKSSDTSEQITVKKYHVVGIKGILKIDEGTLTCCEVSEDFQDIAPLKINYRICESLLKDSVILGYGVSYDKVTREPIVDATVDMLKCVDARPDIATHVSKRVVCDFVETPYKKLGLVGPDDLGALLVHTDDNKKPVILGFASKAGDKDIKDKDTPFYGERCSRFLRLSSHYNAYKLEKLITTPIAPGYEEISAVPDISGEFDRLPGSSLLWASNSGAQTISMTGPIDQHCVLIDPFVFLTIKAEPRTTVGKMININGRDYNVRGINPISPEVCLIYLKEPVLNPNPVRFFHYVDDRHPVGRFIDTSLEEYKRLRPFEVVEVDDQYYLSYWPKSYNFPEKMQEIRDAIYRDVIGDALGLHE